MTKAVILRGPAGVGKSTIGQALRNQLADNWAYLDIDMLKHIIAADSSEFRSQTAHDMANYFIEKLLQHNTKIIIEEIFKADYYKKVISLLEKYNYETLTVFLTAPTKTLIQRDAARFKHKGEQTIKDLSQTIRPLKENLTLDTSKQSVNDLVKRILQEIH
jgi:predicted kinase